MTSCLDRKNTRLGSSKAMVKQLSFSGIFGNKQATNPDLYNWNKVKVRYCDGSSFTGDVEAVDPVSRSSLIQSSTVGLREALTLLRFRRRRRPPIFTSEEGGSSSPSWRTCSPRG